MRLLDFSKWKRKKPKKLLGLQVEEVSLVDSPANMIPLMIVKDKNFKGKVKKVKSDKLECNIVTDFTKDGTKVKINGKKVDGIGAISLYNYVTYLDNGMPGDPRVAFSYTTYNQSDGSEEVVRYDYSYKEPTNVEKETKDMNTELTKTLKNLFKEVPDGFDELNDEEQKELAKNLSLVEEYVDDMPPALREAIGNVFLLVKTSTSEKASIADILTEAAEKIRAVEGDKDKKEDEEGDKDKKDDKKEDDSKGEKKPAGDNDVNLNVNVQVKPEDSSDKKDDKKDDKKSDTDDSKKEEEVNLSAEEIETLADKMAEGMDEVLGG